MSKRKTANGKPKAIGKNKGVWFNLDDPMERELLERIENSGINFSNLVKNLLFFWDMTQRGVSMTGATMFPTLPQAPGTYQTMPVRPDEPTVAVTENCGLPMDDDEDD